MSGDKEIASPDGEGEAIKGPATVPIYGDRGIASPEWGGGGGSKVQLQYPY